MKNKKQILNYDLDSLSLKSEQEWMGDQYKKEIRKHNAMKKKNFELKKHKKNLKKLASSEVGSLMQILKKAIGKRI